FAGRFPLPLLDRLLEHLQQERNGDHRAGSPLTRLLQQVVGKKTRAVAQLGTLEQRNQEAAGQLQQVVQRKNGEKNLSRTASQRGSQPIPIEEQAAKAQADPLGGRRLAVNVNQESRSFGVTLANRQPRLRAG